MFRSQAEMQDSELTVHSAEAPLNPDTILKVLCNVGVTELPALLAGDQSALELVLFNLVRNALSNSDGKPVRLLAAFDYTSRQLQVQVIDQGRGISSERLEAINRLLEGKGQQDLSSSDVSGLWFCKSVVELNEGQISLMSEGANTGTIVQFSMKMSSPDAVELDLTNQYQLHSERALIPTQEKALTQGFQPI